ncbi:3-oxoacyl-ACP reductase FabG [Microbacterium saperdae]|uniref:3-oxoacyl-[acyl-carrier protein] reductase n=1 Tax=Microbacterium saperdae TaxID=69368 RepID=A0A543BL93_9MICO|nr:3-oxoacyl-ACP reductase FabG [Microbacterium saperdae]TQL85607.1 3-oxoacyl-[acyl-carrier protein] reductase [Microbacterium saperdae]GGM62332.1 3-oxoacyl-ACP reductase [Microbacterium saperdae]
MESSGVKPSRRFGSQIAVVTGAAGGIGHATALRLAREGATSVIIDLDAQRTEAAVAAIGADLEVADSGGGAFGIACDVSDSSAVEHTFAEIVARFGGIDVLVNNAGITRDNLLFKLERPDWDAVMTTNLTSVYLCCRAAQSSMVDRGRGRIVNVSSRSALGNRGQANYAAAKAGVQGLTATLAIELGPFGITVNAVAPGYIATGMTASTARRVGLSAEEHMAIAAERTPLRRVGVPDDIASVIVFFASDDAGYVSGQTLYVNGGAR